MFISERDGYVRVDLTGGVKRVRAVKKPDFSTPPVPRDALEFTLPSGTKLEILLPPGYLKELRKVLKG